MKNTHLISKTIAVVFICFFVLSCSSDDDNNSLNLPLQTEVEADLELGTWRITRFIDDGENETSDFAGYNFTFAESGELTATNGTNTFDGSWRITSDGPNINDFELVIVFNLTNDFQDLTDEWDFISVSVNRIELIDDSDDNDPDDFLTFERN
jgi:hypothetical protein